MSGGTELAVVDSEQALSMVDGPNPAGAVAYARKLSATIADTLEVGNGFDMIQGKKHVKAEGWQTIAAMTGHTAEVEWSRPVEGFEPFKGLRAWEARAIVRDQNGTIVAAGESMASPSEGAPWARQDFSIRSMAQTRALSRALASRMRYVVVLAGFSGAPAEEMGAADVPAPADIARGRFKMLRDELGQGEKTMLALLGDHPEDISEDLAFAEFLLKLGAAAGEDEEPVEGEVVEEAATPTTGQQVLDKVKAKDAKGKDPHS